MITTFASFFRRCCSRPACQLKSHTQHRSRELSFDRPDLRSDGRLVMTADAANVVMELRSDGAGTDTSEAFLGTPEIAVAGILTIPEIRLAERKTQYR